MVTSGVPLNSVMGLVLFSMTTDDLDSLSKLSDDTKLDQSVDLLEDRKVLYRDLDSLNGWAKDNCMRFVTQNVHSCTWSHNNLMQHYRPEEE